MDPPDDDIEFDFFDEPAASEPDASAHRPLPERRRPLPQRMGRPPGRPADPSPPLRQLATLGVGVFCAIVVVLFFGVVISSCAGASRRTVYADYIRRVDTIAQQSTDDGKLTTLALTTPGYTVSNVVNALARVASAEQQNVRAADSLSAPGRLRDEHLDLIEALELRVDGVDGLASAFQGMIGSKACQDTDASASTLSSWVYRLVASDVVWEDLFQKPAQAQIDHDIGPHQLAVPGSTFLVMPDAFASSQAMELVLQRICTPAGSVSSGPHGTNIASVTALTTGTGGKAQYLIEGRLNTITTSATSAIRVTIHDGGVAQQVGIRVTLTMPQESGAPISQHKTVSLIDPGQYAFVTFDDLGNLPFGRTQSRLTVNVAAVPGEVDLNNNSASYNVVFTVPGK